MHMTLPCIARHLITTPQAPAGAPPDVWSQLLSCCEGEHGDEGEVEEEEALAGPG